MNTSESMRRTLLKKEGRTMKQLIVIKVGGNALEELTPAFFAQLSYWHKQGKRILLVHGGGNTISEWAQQLALPVKKENGIRVTDEQTLAITKMVLLGDIQPQFLAMFTRYQLPVFGLHAAMDQLITGAYLDQEKYGYVGNITGVNQEKFAHILAQGIGVVAPLALDSKGQWLNVNGDTAAAQIASFLQAEALYFLTDVPGVLHQGEVVKVLTQKQAQVLKKQNIVTKGMQPKLAAAFYAAYTGVQKITVTNSLTTVGTSIQKGNDQHDDTFSNL